MPVRSNSGPSDSTPRVPSPVPAGSGPAGSGPANSGAPGLARASSGVASASAAEIHPPGAVSVPPLWGPAGGLARSPGGAQRPRYSPLFLLIMVLIIAAAGLVYELAIAAVASYVLGDSVTQFSTVIGLYLSAMGLGAYLSQFIRSRLNIAFVDVELTTALLGGFSAPSLFFAFGYTSAFQLFLFTEVVIVGTLVGLELPLLIRILKNAYELDQLIARSLSFDYAGALVGSLAFSLVLMPRLGLIQSSLVAGLLNAIVGLASTFVLLPANTQEIAALRRARLRAVGVVLVLLAGLAGGDSLSALAERAIYPGKVTVTRQSPYQRIVLTETHGRLQLYLNGSLQFDEADEHRYHEALVHPAMASANARRSVLIGGGGDGLAVREVLRWPDVERVVLVDLDAQMTGLAAQEPRLVRLNRGSLADPRVQVENADAMVWLAQSSDIFDVILLDFPDPSNYSIGKLYSESFFRVAQQRLTPDGVLSVQSTSPLFARSAYWCVVATLEATGLSVRPYHVFVPSFGEWGFVLARRTPFGPSAAPLPPNLNLRFLDAAELANAFQFGPDTERLVARSNRLDNQALVQYYVDAWSRWD